MTIIWQEAILHTKMFFRERQAVFWGFVFPAVLLVLFCSIFGGSPERSSELTAGLICINVMSGSLFGTAVIIVVAREQGILRRYKVAPVALWKISVGLLSSRLLSITLTTLFLVGLARLVYKITLPSAFAAAAAVFLVGTFMFCALSFAVASLTRTTSQANAVVQVIFMPMMFLSGATFPVDLMPVWMQKLSGVLPATYFVAALKSVMVNGGGVADNMVNLSVMAVFTLIALALSVNFFRWE